MRPNPASARSLCAALLAAAALLATAAGHAAVVPDDSSPVAAKAYRHPDLSIPNLYRPEAPPGALVAATGARDLRSGRWGTLLPTVPLLPGPGVGNRLSWSGLGLLPPAGKTDLEAAAWSRFRDYVGAHRSLLDVDPAELAEPGRVTVHDGGRLIQIHAPRVVAGVPVRDSYLTAVVNRGNLILFGARNWGEIDAPTVARLGAGTAQRVLASHLAPLAIERYRRLPRLALVPLARGRDLARVAPGAGYTYRLAWVLEPVVRGDHGRWQALVDATRGELLSLEDTLVHASTREVVGGVLPLSNDGIPPSGVEQPGWPMPFADVVNAGETLFTDHGGNLQSCVDGTITTHLDGRFIRIQETCGAINESTTGDVLDLGTSGGTNCTVPPGHSPGDTHAARSGFYELNRIKELARGQVPDNLWLDDPLIARMNISPLCNANWDSGQVNFYRSAPGCRNTGELAGIFDHEWGHGYDDNDAAPFVSNPGEGIADVYAAVRLDTSCIGRGFLTSGFCPGYGDPCTAASGCTGVRDIDFANRASGAPHDIAWIDANCGGGPAPCGGIVHCEGAVYAEAVWDLAKRDLPTAPFGLDSNTALELATRLTFQGAGPVGEWYQCINGTGTGDGCNADGGYLNYLAADDDNGNLADGTPHMTAIFAAFDRHGIACPTPTVQNGGCAGSPTTAPVVTAVTFDRGTRLSWPEVTGATAYEVFRTEGVSACDFGKVRVARTADASFIDDGLLNDRDYFYTVAAVGPADSCLGPMSACTQVTPAAGPNVGIDADSAVLTTSDGDNDRFVDNCETLGLDFDVVNVGTGGLTNVRIVDAQPSNPGIMVTTAFPVTVAASLAACGSAPGSFAFTAEDVSFNETVEFRVLLTADELAGEVRPRTLRLLGSESDFESHASRTFTFETNEEGWQTVQGTFARNSAGGGAQGTAFYFDSSAFLDDQCDEVRSPIVELSSTSTLSLWNQFGIEGFSGVWYDRANVGLRDAESGVRTPVAPDGGRLYNASGPNGVCGLTGQSGWAATMAAWAQSTFSAGALGSAAVAGDLLELDVRYGTDPAANGFGFHFDQVTLTDFELQVADVQSNSCNGVCESGKTAGIWQLPVPTGTTSGFAEGRLFIGDVFAYKLLARLIRTSNTGGNIRGELRDGVAPEPDFIVRGTYAITHPPGKGRFSAAIFAPGSDVQVGKIGGTFKDDPATTTPPGTYEGEWKICE